jgi:hypothetical protein
MANLPRATEFFETPVAVLINPQRAKRCSR